MTTLTSCTTGRGCFERRYRRCDGAASFRYYLRLGPLRVRVPWLLWAMFA